MEVKTPKQLRDTLWACAKAIQHSQASVTSLEIQLAQAKIDLANALSDFGGAVFKGIRDDMPDEKLEVGSERCTAQLGAATHADGAERCKLKPHHKGPHDFAEGND